MMRSIVGGNVVWKSSVGGRSTDELPKARYMRGNLVLKSKS